MHAEKNATQFGSGRWLIHLGVLLMTFGAGAFLGFIVGRAPIFAQAAPQPLTDRAERHANDAEYYARRSIVGISRIERNRSQAH